MAAEGGGFFSASASGYSKGLTLLLLGQQKKEDKPMRVSPWDQDRLVQMDSTKNRLSRCCASFICFGRTSAALDTPSPLKVGPAQQQESLDDSVATSFDKSKDHVADEDNGDVATVVLNSNLKKSVKSCTAASIRSINDMEGIDTAENAADHVEKKKVQWKDACGCELFEIREFEPRYLCLLFSSSKFQKLRI